YQGFFLYFIVRLAEVFHNIIKALYVYIHFYTSKMQSKSIASYPSGLHVFTESFQSRQRQKSFILTANVSAFCRTRTTCERISVSFIATTPSFEAGTFTLAQAEAIVFSVVSQPPMPSGTRSSRLKITLSRKSPARTSIHLFKVEQFFYPERKNRHFLIVYGLAIAV